MKNGKYIKNGIERWFKNDKLHRLDGPALIYTNGTEYWYKDGELHRLNGPAITYSNGDEFWFVNGIEIFPEINLIEIPETEEEKLSLINQINFIEINKEYILINEYLKRDERFYNKYKVLFE